MQFDLSSSDRVNMNGWVHIPCQLSTLAMCLLWAVSGQCKLIASNLGFCLQCVHYQQVFVMDRCPLRYVLLYICIYVYIYIYTQICLPVISVVIWFH